MSENCSAFFKSYCLNVLRAFFFFVVVFVAAHRTVWKELVVSREISGRGAAIEGTVILLNGATKALECAIGTYRRVSLTSAEQKLIDIGARSAKTLVPSADPMNVGEQMSSVRIGNGKLPSVVWQTKSYSLYLKIIAESAFLM